MQNISSQRKEEVNISYLTIFKILEIGRHFLDISNMQDLLAHLKLRPSEFHAIMRIFILTLDKPEGISLKTFAQFSKLSQPAASMQVATLLEKGYVRRKSDPSDKRKMLLSISKEHMVHFEEMMSKQEIVLNERIQHISIEKRKELIEFSEGMYDYLHAFSFTK